MALTAGMHLTQVVVKGTYDGQDYRNVLHFNTNVTVNDGNRDALLLALATAMLECFVTHLLPALPSLFQIQAVSAQELWPTHSEAVEVLSTSGANNGGIDGDGFPGFASMGVVIRTGLAARSRRGRMFLPAPAESNASAGTLGTTAQAAVVAFLNCLAGKFLVGGTSDYDIGVYSRIGVGSRPPVYQNGTFTPAKSFTSRKNLFVMRRRRIGTGS